MGWSNCHFIPHLISQAAEWFSDKSQATSLCTLLALSTLVYLAKCFILLAMINPAQSRLHMVITDRGSVSGCVFERVQLCVCVTLVEGFYDTAETPLPTTTHTYARKGCKLQPLWQGCQTLSMQGLVYAGFRFFPFNEALENQVWGVPY